jgi:hypothetical protein
VAGVAGKCAVENWALKRSASCSNDCIAGVCCAQIKHPNPFVPKIENRVGALVQKLMAPFCGRRYSFGVRGRWLGQK